MNDVTTVQSAIDLAVERFEEECYLESNGILLDLVAAGFDSTYVSFCIARNFLYMKDFGSARHWFDLSAAAESPFHWTFYELMRLHGEMGESAQAEHYLVLFLKSPETHNLNDVHRHEILKVAHECFLYDRKRAAALYERISRSGIWDYLCELRIAERLIDLNRLDQADARLQALRSVRELDCWGLFALARVRFGQGQVDEAISCVVRAIDKQPDNASASILGIHKLIDFRAAGLARKFLDDHLLSLASTNTLIAQEVANLEFRLAVLERKHDRVLEICRTPDFLERAPEWLPVEALHALSPPDYDRGPKATEAGNEIAAFLQRQEKFTLGMVIALHQFYVRGGDWAQLAELDERLRHSPLFDDPEVVLRRFEVLCMTSRLREAEALYRKHYAERSLLRSESIAVMRLLSEVKLWDEAGKVLLGFFDKGYEFAAGEYFFMQVCRRAGLHGEIIRRIDAFAGPGASTHYGQLRQLVVDDALVKDLTGNLGDGVTARLSENNSVLRKPALKASRKRRLAGILCCNRAYFFSHLTFLASYAARNPDAGRIDWYAVYDSDIPDRWHAITKRFAAKLSLEITILKEDKILDCGVARIESYGIFTGGNTLSRSAFLRIYAARYLRQRGGYDRAVYIDSDIVCLREISPLWSLPFEGRLLMARTEELSPEVRSAAARNELDPVSYFNSGVLAFDLLNPEVDAHLAQAIHLAENEQGRLIFHDQCALNIAFKDRVRFLAAEFNHFLRPHRQDNGDLGEARLIHFLDRPKPWDVSYNRNYRVHWEQQAAFVRALLSASEYNQLAAAANR